MDFRSRAGLRAGANHRGRHPPRPGRRWLLPTAWDQLSPAAYSSMAPCSPGEAPRIPTAVTSFKRRARVSIVLGVPAIPMYTTLFPGSTRSSARAGSAAELDAVDDGVPWQRRQVVRRPDAGETRVFGQRPWIAASTQAGEPLRPALEANIAASSPMVPGPSTRRRSPEPGSAPQHRPERVAAWLDHCPGNHHRPRPAADAEPSPEPRSARPGRRGTRAGCRFRTGPRTRVCSPPRQRRQLPAAEHRVAGDPAPEPRRVDARRRCPGHGAAPFVAEPHRITRRNPDAGRPSRR